MSASSSATTSQIRDIVNQLQTPLEDLSSLLSALCAPLAVLGVLPKTLRKYNTSPLSANVDVVKHIPTLQRAVLLHIIPTWSKELVKSSTAEATTSYFYPDSSLNSQAAGEIALQAYSTLLSNPIDDHSIPIISELSKQYSISELYDAVFGPKDDSVKQQARWEDVVKDVLAVPAKVANAAANLHMDVPEEIQPGPYFQNVCLSFDGVIARGAGAVRADALSYLLSRLVNLGVFPSSPPSLPSQPSFFQATFPQIRSRVLQWHAQSYSNSWQSIISALSSVYTLQRIVTSLLAHLPLPIPPLDARAGQRRLVRTEAWLLRSVLGTLSPEIDELWDALMTALVGREWSGGHARIITCWASGAQVGSFNDAAQDHLLSSVLDIWASSEHVKHSLLQRHQFITSLLLLTFCSLSPNSPRITSLAIDPSFISGVGAYISHLDPSVRRCGMLAAEVVAHRAGKKLAFGDWEGDGPGKVWARDLRSLLDRRDADVEADEAEPEEALPVKDSKSVPEPSHAPPSRSTVQVVQTDGHDSDDSLTGYDSPGSSRASSPTPSELEEMEKDPTIHVGKKKIPRPVYLAQLGELLRPSTGQKYDEQQEADMMEMALNCAEELIRRKQHYGLELEENAVNLTFGLIGLGDKYDLDDFSSKRQGALSALVACCPQKAAPTIIQEFFSNQYSTDQRFTMLNALALGARELAGLAIPPSQVPAARVAFASKQLPPAQHRKYITSGDELYNPVQYLLEDISKNTIAKTKESGESQVPQMTRERHLRIRQPAKVMDVTNARSSTTSSLQSTPPRQRTTFTAVAAQHFVYPLVTRFWSFLRDEQSREERTAHLAKLHQYRGAGTGLILNPLVLARFLEMMSVLMHAARNAPEWGAVLAPDVLELAVTLGTRPLSMIDTEDQTPQGGPTDAETKAAAVLSAALELALIVVDGCVDLDGGRALGLEHTALLLGVGEWAQKVFERLDKGEKMAGGGGVQEVKLSRAAAALVLKVDEVTSRWKRSMMGLLEM